MRLIRLYIRVLGQLGSDMRVGALLALANIALAISAFAEPILFGRIIDVLTRAQIPNSSPVTFGVLMPLILAWVAFGLFSIGAGALVALHADRLAHRRRLSVVASYFEHVLELPLAFHTSTHSGRVLKVMLEGSGAMSWLWLGFFREHLSALIALVVLLPLTVFLNWRLGLLLVALVAVFALLTAIVLRKTETLQGTVERYHSSLAEHASDALGNVPVIQSFTRIEAESRSLRTIIQQLLQAQNPVLSWWALASVASRASATITVTAIFLMGTWLHLNGLATIGEVVMFMSMATMLIGRLEQAVSFINQLFMQAPKLQEFFEILDTTPAVHDRANARNVERFRGDVVFDDVSFSYDGKRSAVQDVSFAVQSGENVALVGATGSGKSTTLGLLHRAFDPQSGCIRIDDLDIRDVTLSSLRRNIGVVFQEPMLFARTIRENLQVGRPDATDAEMIEALERAQAIEFISRQSEGLDTVIGERGRSLSGGERQRLSIARALLKNPPILILDEATSALDAATERKLQLALDEVMKGRTTFVIAHRLATIRNANRILVFDQGRVIETGTFDELVATGGRFAELAKAQFMAAEEPPPKRVRVSAHA
ncbi:glucan ABC transporter ATP-binding protein/ permease [Microvirga mediterraneensis]|uniref:Glucan ABC transporter ATP-binding protein/ permease n=1 Tax=Microvirga mediterraneensis TaxID=2754695 RepID=A0A838BIH7_9HYPH|nr:glucan ABC transporter ATP-binding protein/ permease [Microvirga mediterraneensis]MBA1154899.1 glucan ABC transporter ATP-binding protein/ permease [Microvirga mediterraneensis]